MIVGVNLPGHDARRFVDRAFLPSFIRKHFRSTAHDSRNTNHESRACPPERVTTHGSRGFTLIELILAVAILIILATVSVPLARVMVKRRKETDLRYRLIQIRRAIDRYKDAADKNQIQVKAGTEGYPPDLDTLVKGVQLTGASDKHVRFLARIPKDPMTGNAEWGMRSVQDDPDTTSWGGQDVFDVYSKSAGTALDGTKYSEW